MQQGDADSATQELVPVPGPAVDPDGWRGAWRAAGWGLLAAWVLVALLVVLGRGPTTTPAMEWPVVRVPGALEPAVALVWLATLGVLVLGPQPRRATRWSWFWLVSLVPSVGGLAFLVLGGPAGLVGPPADPARRLSGFMGFGLAVIGGGAVTVAVALATLPL